MKLPDFLTFAPLELLRQKMNAPLTSDDVGVRIKSGLSLEDIQAIETTGLEVDLSQITAHPVDGTLLYKGIRVLVYIKEPRTYHNDYHADSHTNMMPKFHFADCRTYGAMKRQGRKDRYVVSTRTDGVFPVIAQLSGNEELVPLHVCKNCLQSIKYKGYPHNKASIFQEFNLKEYFHLYPRDLIIDKPRHTNITAPRDVYPEDWNKIASYMKERVKWQCQECNIDLSKPQHRKFLHVHHKDGSRSNNRMSNLKPLCVQCHAKQPNHGHMKGREDLKQFKKLFNQRDLFL